MQQTVVVARKNDLLATMHEQYHLFLLGMLAFAVIVGWKIGKDLDVKQIGFMLLSQYQLLI